MIAGIIELPPGPGYLLESVRSIVVCVVRVERKEGAERDLDRVTNAVTHGL